MRVRRPKPRRGMKKETPLHLKIRVTPTHRMKLRTLLSLVERAIRTGTVPPGIEIHWIDWAKEGSAGRAHAEGRIPDPGREALRRWYGAMEKSGLRVGRIKRDVTGQG